MTITRQKLFKRWSNMWNGCTNPKDTGWRSSGARGIKVCRRWISFEKFYEDITTKIPPPTTTKHYCLARVDQAKDWSQNNIKWQTEKELANRRIDADYHTINRVKKSLKAWCEHYNIRHSTVFSRVHTYGWTIKQALELEPHK